MLTKLKSMKQFQNIELRGLNILNVSYMIKTVAKFIKPRMLYLE